MQKKKTDPGSTQAPCSVLTAGIILVLSSNSSTTEVRLIICVPKTPCGAVTTDDSLGLLQVINVLMLTLGHGPDSRNAK